jgi:hypothetical protein
VTRALFCALSLSRLDGAPILTHKTPLAIPTGQSGKGCVSLNFLFALNSSLSNVESQVTRTVVECLNPPRLEVTQLIHDSLAVKRLGGSSKT